MDEANILFLTGAEKKPLSVDDQGNGLPVNPGLSGSQVGSDVTAAWANSDPADTVKSVILTAPTMRVVQYALIVYNPSTETNITIQIAATETVLAAGTRYAKIATLSVPKSQGIKGTTINTHEYLIEGLFLGGTAVMSYWSNDTALSVAGAFTAYARLREVSN